MKIGSVSLTLSHFTRIPSLSFSLCFLYLPSPIVTLSFSLNNSLVLPLSLSLAHSTPSSVHSPLISLFLPSFLLFRLHDLPFILDQVPKLCFAIFFVPLSRYYLSTIVCFSSCFFSLFPPFSLYFLSFLFSSLFPPSFLS